MSEDAPPRRPLPCVALGPAVDRASCACPMKHTHQCLKDHGLVRPGVECHDCPDYEADD